MEITVRNVNEAFAEIFWKLKVLNLQPEPTRNGPALVVPEPVIITYRNPAERVLFHHGRDANPVFHLMEAIWMLAGRNDVAFLEQFNSRIGQYSDDGVTFNAAYGHRWRSHFGADQLLWVIRLLQRDPHTRQAVVQMWDPADLDRPTKDKACNTQLVFDCRGGRLNMSVFNRSNDIWWGALGANAVHFSVLQEFVAAAVGLPVGVYRQISNNLHLYTELYDAAWYVKNPPHAEEFDMYAAGHVTTRPLLRSRDYAGFLLECDRFCRSPFDERVEYEHPFFSEVARPIAMVSRVRRAQAGTGQGWAANIRAEDWRHAAFGWIHRRELARAKKAE